MQPTQGLQVDVDTRPCRWRVVVAGGRPRLPRPRHHLQFGGARVRSSAELRRAAPGGCCWHPLPQAPKRKAAPPHPVVIRPCHARAAAGGLRREQAAPPRVGSRGFLPLDGHSGPAAAAAGGAARVARHVVVEGGRGVGEVGVDVNVGGGTGRQVHLRVAVTPHRGGGGGARRGQGRQVPVAVGVPWPVGVAVLMGVRGGGGVRQLLHPHHAVEHRPLIKVSQGCGGWIKGSGRAVGDLPQPRPARAAARRGTRARPPPTPVCLPAHPGRPCVGKGSGRA